MLTVRLEVPEGGKQGLNTYPLIFTCFPMLEHTFIFNLQILVLKQRFISPLNGQSFTFRGG